MSADQWPSFISRIVLQRLTGIALAAVEAGELSLRSDHGDDLRNRHVTAMLQALALERRLLDVASAFEQDGIEFVVLKGPVLAHEIYPDPSWRPFVDVDLLVRGRDWKRALQIVGTAGFQRILPEPKAGFDERFGKAALHRDGDGIQLDLHRTLVVGPFGLWIKTDELFDNRATFGLGGRTLHRPDDTVLLVHACVHASLGWSPPLILPLRDIVQIAQRGVVDRDRFTDLTERWHLPAVVRHSLDAVSQRLGIELPELAEATSSLSVGRSQLRALRVYTSTRDTPGRLTLITLRAIPGLRAKAAFIRAMLLPDEPFLAAKAGIGHRPSYLRRWFSPLRWLGKAPSKMLKKETT